MTNVIIMMILILLNEVHTFQEIEEMYRLHNHGT